MRFLVDENLSPHVAELLTKSGHEALHVRGLDAVSAPDQTVMELARRDDRVIVSADTDFGALLAHRRATKPSVLLVRDVIDLRPPELVELIVEQLDGLSAAFEAGAIAALTRAGVRLRMLPLR